MLLNIVVVFSTALLSLAFADTTYSTTTSTFSSAVATHTIAVGAGGGGFNFYPQQTYAKVNDVIEWQFYPLNHSVVRSSYGNKPCIPYEWTGGPGATGFWSGFMPVALVLKDPPKFQVTVNDTAPIFFYCSAPGACFQGMIGVINPNATQTFAAQMSFALNSTEEFSPGESFLPETLEPTFSRTTTYTGATAAPTVAPATTSSTTPAPTTKSSSLPTGAIIGIAIGGCALLVLAAALIYMCGRQKTVQEILRQSQLPAPAQNSYQPTSPGLSEANYSNMQKEPSMAVSRDGHFSTQSFAPPTERSMSPPVDERTGIMGMHPLHAGSQGYPSPGLMSPNSPGYPSPVYSDNLRHEMAGVRPFSPNDTGPHELAVPTPNTSPREQNEHRPFSYTDSESGYARAPLTPGKPETGTY